MKDGSQGAGWKQEPTKELEVIGKVRSCDAQIRFSFLGPFVLEILALMVDERKAWLERGIKPSRTDQNVHSILLAVVAKAAIGCDLLNLTIHHFDVLLA